MSDKQIIDYIWLSLIITISLNIGSKYMDDTFRTDYIEKISCLAVSKVKPITKISISFRIG